LARHLDEARWPPAGRAERLLCFGCGFVAGLVLGFGLFVAIAFQASPARPWPLVLLTAVVCGVLAAWQWERFWRWWLRLAAWLP
jgi:hypothetical protein